MPVTKEFPELIEDRPSMLGKVCQAFADQEVNILVLPDPREICNSTHHRQAGHPQTVLDNEKLTYAEKEIVQIKIQHRPGEIAASRLGKAHININYVGKAATILERTAAAHGKS
jgi:hypothetical protein